MDHEYDGLIGRRVAAARRRIRVWNFLLASAALLPVFLSAWCVEAALRQFVEAPAGVLLGIRLALGAGALAYLAWAALRGTGAFRVARMIDRRADLEDRVASGLEFKALAGRGPYHEAQIRDADRALAGVKPGPLFPFDFRLAARRLLLGALVAPLLLAVTHLHLPLLFSGEPREGEAPAAEETFAQAEPGAIMPTLEEAGLDQDMLELIRPAEELIGRWRERLREISERREAAERERAPESELPPEGGREETSPVMQRVPISQREYTRTIEPDAGEQSIRLADLQSLVDREADGGYAEAFEYLDQQIFSDPASLEALEEFAQQVSRNAQDQIQAGGGQMFQSSFAGDRNPGAEGDDVGAHMNQLQGAQAQSFAEFMAEYAAHLSRLTQTMQDVIAQADAQNGEGAGQLRVEETFQLADLDLETVPRYRLDEITPEDLEHGTIRPLAPEETGGSDAGFGFGTADGVFRVPRVDREATRYAELESQYGEGFSMQIYEDLEQGNVEQYTSLFRTYALGAEQILSLEDIPLAIQNYVREYFLAIGPARVTGDSE